VRVDDPRLTVREVETPRQPLRVIVDSRLETPPTARILEGGNVVIFAGQPGSAPGGAEVVVLPNQNRKVDLPRMLEELARRGVNELHVEAGFRLNGFLGDGAQGIVDLPDFKSLGERPRLRILSIERLGEDLRILARPA
jgi:diaminohydroxyphosphoribosylaminopyrimidine deaminase/5-amino-6-(5-phosphoribosylamino)uracil reductase